MDCYLIEGQKLLYRVSLALVRYFSKTLRSNSNFNGAVKNNGLRGAFYKFAKEIPVSPATILQRSFKFRDFGRAKIQKHYLSIEIDLKAKGLTFHAERTRSEDNLPSPRALEDIRQVSDTLTYKQVSRFILQRKVGYKS